MSITRVTAAALRRTLPLALLGAGLAPCPAAAETHRLKPSVGQLREAGFYTVSPRLRP